MNGTVPVSLLVGLATLALAQNRGPMYGSGGGYRPSGYASGFGNVLSPGTGRAPAGFGNVLSPGTGIPPGATSRPGTFGRGGLGGSQAGNRRGGRSATYVPYAFPVYVGGYGYMYGDGYGTPPEPPQPAVASEPGAPAAPQVIINQYFTPDTARLTVREYGGEGSDTSGVHVYHAPGREPDADAAEDRRGQPEDKPTIYLIAFRDNSLQSALAYWVEGDTLHYVTVQGSHNKASLDLVDRAFSEQINRERNLDFHLPAK